MGEYYVLIENQVILCIFFSLMDILSWKAPRQLSDPLMIHRVREDGGIFTTQMIQINASIYNHRL